MKQILKSEALRHKVMESLDRHLGLQEVEAARISRQSEHGEVSPTHRPSLTPKRYYWYLFLF